MAFVYILQSKVNNRFYIGSTTNLYRRVKEHNEGKTKYTSLTKPFKLVFYQEFKTLKEAKRIEYRLKKMKSRIVIEKIIREGNIKIKA